MDFRVRSVALSEIDTADQTFRITTHSDVSDLLASIGSLGLLQPPVLAHKENAYTVVCGFRRIAACRSLAIPQIAARVDDGRLEGLDLARVAIADNAFQRPLNVVEQSRALALIRRFAHHAANWAAIAGTVGLPASEAAMQRLAQIADMPDSLQMAVASDRIALPVAISINTLQPDDARVMFQLLEGLNAGLNNQRELFEFIVELSIIKETSIARLLEQEAIAATLADEKSSMPQRVQRLRQVLRKLRYPELSKAEDRFHQAFSALKVNPAIQLQPPPFFEGKSYRLALSIRSRQQLQSLLPDLQKIADHPHILPE